VTEQAAKLTVKVKLHAMQPALRPTPAPPARLSKLKVTLGLLLLVVLTGFGYFLWQQWIGQVQNAVAQQQAHELDTVNTDNIAEIDNTFDSNLKQPVHTPTVAGAVTVGLPVTTAPNNTSSANSPEATPSASPKRGLIATAAVVEQPAQQQAPNLINHNGSAVATSVQTSVQASVQTSAQAKQPVNARLLPEGFSRIVLAATMEQLEPGAAIDKLVAQQQIQRLYIFTELTGYAGQQLSHRWSFAGQVQTEALLTFEDSPWRTYSEKWLLPDQLGSWRVEIIDQQQNVLYQHDFEYQ
jgi:hypothetical protein